MTRYLYFTRHVQSEWNVSDQICGSTDIPLTDKGREQAEILAQQIKEEGIHIDEILCSPLKRAKETAEIIGRVNNIPVKVEPRLVEQNFGRWEGTSPRSSIGFQKAKLCFIDSYGNGETMFKAAHRVYSLLDEICADSFGKTYLLAAHNGISRFMESYFRDMTNEEFAAFGIGNCQLVRYELKDSCK